MPKRKPHPHQPTLTGLPSDLSDPAPDRPLTDALRRGLDEIDPNSNTTYLHSLIKDWLTKASSGSFPHLKELLVRIEGKPVEAVETTRNPIFEQTRIILDRHAPTPPQRNRDRMPESGREG